MKRKNNNPARHNKAKIDLKPRDWVSIGEAIRSERNTMPVGMRYSPELEEIALREYDKGFPLEYIPRINLLDLGRHYLN